MSLYLLFLIHVPRARSFRRRCVILHGFGADIEADGDVLPDHIAGGPIAAADIEIIALDGHGALDLRVLPFFVFCDGKCERQGDVFGDTLDGQLPVRFKLIALKMPESLGGETRLGMILHVEPYFLGDVGIAFLLAGLCAGRFDYDLDAAFGKIIDGKADIAAETFEIARKWCASLRAFKGER